MMRCRVFITLALLALATVAPASDRASAQADDPPTPAPPAKEAVQPGDYRGRIMLGQLPREYRMHVPAGYGPEIPMPLVIALHPFASTALEQDVLSSMSPKADKEGFIAVYPQALGNPPVWQFGSFVEERNIDLEFLRLLIRSLQERLAIDPARVYVTGYSNGGGLVHDVACEMADIVAAVAPVAGTYDAASPDCVPARPVPVIAFHGTGDNTLPYEGVEGKLMPVRAWASAWAGRNGCAATSAVTFQEGDVTGETWGDCKDGADVALYTIEGFGHYWPRTDRIPGAPAGFQTAGINATDVMWDFFAAHPMPQTVAAVRARAGGFAPGNAFGSLVSRGVLRWYMVYVPAGYTPGVPTPLVIDYHGAYSTPQWEAISSQMSAKADEAGFIVVYPEAFGVSRNWFFWANAQGPDDVAFTRDLIAELSGWLSIDPARIYATGLSNGGGMANRVACELADVIAAFAQVAGTYPLPEGCAPSRPVPAMTFHGTADDVLPYYGVQGSLLAAPDWAANWAQRNGCAATPAVTFEEGVVTGQTWSDCLDRADVILYTIEGFGHRWPRTEPIPDLRESAVTDIDATDVMWDFFAAHPMPENPAAAVPLPEAEPTPKPGFTPEPGDFVGEIESGGLKRRYILHVPPNYVDGAPTPLVLAFHGYGDDPVNYALASGLLDKANEAGFIVVFPEGAGAPRAWTSRPGEEGPDDVQFVRDLLDDLTPKMSIDPARIYATGFSRGGGMVYRLGCELADRIAAIAPVGGSYAEALACAPSRPLPVFAIHGTADTAVPYDGIEGRYLAVAAWAAGWADRNGCAPTAVGSETTAHYQAGDVAVHVQSWRDCDADADVVLQTYENWGHFWPRGDGVDAIWDFLAAHSMPEANAAD